MQHGAQMNTAHKPLKQTAAHWAAFYGDLPALKALTGADFSLTDSQGKTPLQLAEQERHYATAAWLRQQ